MEKIYMEENKNNQQSRTKLNFSIVLSFCVAIFAIVSLIAVGFDQVSYAAETPTAGDSSRATLDSFIFQQKMSGTRSYFINLRSAVGDFAIPIYYRTENGENKSVFCVEHDIYANVGETYTRYTANGGVPSGFSDDVYYGVLYILSKSKSVDPSNSGISGTTGVLEDAATQAAIWAYLYDKKNGAAPHSLVMQAVTTPELDGRTARDVIRTFSAYDATDEVVSTLPVVNDLSGKIDSVVNQAMSATKERKLNLNYTSRSLSKAADSNDFLSAEFSVSEVTNSGSLVSYEVSATGIDGVKVIDSEGKEKTTFAPGDKFFIKVPGDKVTTSVQKITVRATGTFDGVLTGTYYTNVGFQTVVTVTETTVVDDDEIVLEVAGSPDTSMNSVQTVYFIGLIVLLCGIGIIYANAKPVEEK